MLRLVTFKDPGPAVSAQSTPKVSSKGPKNRVKPTSLSCLVLDPASPPPDSNQPAQLSDDMQVDRVEVPPVK